MTDNFHGVCHYPDKPNKRIGYRSIWSLLWLVWKYNRKCKRSNYEMMLSVKLPIQ